MDRCNVIVVGASAGGVTYVLPLASIPPAVRRLVALGARAGLGRDPPSAR